MLFLLFNRTILEEEILEKEEQDLSEDMHLQMTFPRLARRKLGLEVCLDVHFNK